MKLRFLSPTAKGHLCSCPSARHKAGDTFFCSNGTDIVEMVTEIWSHASLLRALFPSAESR